MLLFALCFWLNRILMSFAFVLHCTRALYVATLAAEALWLAAQQSVKEINNLLWHDTPTLLFNLSYTRKIIIKSFRVNPWVQKGEKHTLVKIASRDQLPCCAAVWRHLSVCSVLKRRTFLCKLRGGAKVQIKLVGIFLYAIVGIQHC